MIRRLALAVLLVGAPIGFAQGCGTQGSENGEAGADSSSGDVIQQVIPNDLVVVNGLDQALLALSDTDVRVCLGTSSKDYPLPDDPAKPMPLSNYPGIPLGGGVDLGSHVLPSTIYIVSAVAQDQNFPGGTAVTSCDKIISDSGAAARPYLVASVPTQSSNAFVVVLLDGPTGAAAASAPIDSKTYGPGSDAGVTVNAQLGAFGPWARQGVFAELVDPSDASTPLTVFDGGSVAPDASIPIALPSFTDRALRFTSAGAVPGSFSQSFQSIQAVSDPTTSPEVFYGVRSNFLFLALGTPQPDGGAPSFGGRGLHVVAIPYVP